MVVELNLEGASMNLEKYFRTRQRKGRKPMTIKGKRCEECHGLGRRLPTLERKRIEHALRCNEHNYNWTKCEACDGLGLVDSTDCETTAQDLSSWETTDSSNMPSVK